MIDILKRFFMVAFNEWKLFYTDAAALLLLVVASVLYAFYYPLPYKYQTVTKIPVAVVDLDHSKMARDLVHMADASQQVSVRHVFDQVRDAEAAMANEEIYGFMVIPPNIEADLQKGQNVNINVFTHGAYVMLHGNISTAFATCALTLGATTKVKRIALSKKVPAAQAMAMRDPIPLGTQIMYNNTGSYSNYVVPSVLIMILQQTLIMGLCVLGGARAHRKFRKLQRDASYENEILLFRYFGRSFAYFIHYCSFIALYHFVVYQVFDFPRRGEVLPMLVFAFIFFFSVINFAMVVSQVFVHRETSMQLFLYVSIPLLFLSNFSWPAEQIPVWMQTLSSLVPSTFAIPAWVSIEQRGAGLFEAAQYLVPLATLSVFYMVLGLVLTHLRDGFGIKTGEM